MYRTLNPDKLLATIQLFRQRIANVFPDSGLSAVSGELEDTAHVCFAEVEKQKRPLWGLRIAVAIGVLVLLLVPVGAWLGFHFAMEFKTFGEFVQATDAGFNVMVLLAGAVIFLVSAESRLKRNSALKVLHELRSLAHVVDMHQLSKDPALDLGALDRGVRLSDRPKAIKEAQDLWFYLSFATDLLSVIGKLAACIAQSQTDRIVLDTVNEIEMISTSLSRKIWQKMSLVSPPPPAMLQPMVPAGPL